MERLRKRCSPSAAGYRRVTRFSSWTVSGRPWPIAIAPRHPAGMRRGRVDRSRRACRGVAVRWSWRARSVIAATSSSPIPLIVSGALPEPECGARAVTAHRCVPGFQQARPTCQPSGRSSKTSSAARSSFDRTVMVVMTKYGTARRGSDRCPNAATDRARFCRVCAFAAHGPLHEVGRRRILDRRLIRAKLLEGVVLRRAGPTSREGTADSGPVKHVEHGFRDEWFDMVGRDHEPPAAAGPGADVSACPAGVRVGRELRSTAACECPGGASQRR